jgi:hypothetical protein
MNTFADYVYEVKHRRAEATWTERHHAELEMPRNGPRFKDRCRRTLAGLGELVSAWGLQLRQAVGANK